MPSGTDSNDEKGHVADTVAKARHAPGPDAESKPESPPDMHAQSWKYAAKRSISEFSRKKCTDMAASLTYFAMLSLFPALLAVVSLLGVAGQAENMTRNILSLLGELASLEVVETLRQPIEQLASAPSAGLALFAGLLGALWSASGYVGAFGRAMNQIYEVAEGRPFYKLRPLMLLLTLVLLVATSVLGLLLIVSGPLAQAIGDVFGLGERAVLVWNIAKWPVIVLCAIVLVAVLYYGAPNVKQPKFRWISLGSAIALFVLAVATVGFFFYVSNFGNYNKTYGAIGGVIVLLLWLWIANLALLFGAVFDAEAERGRQLQAGIAAERSVQLPPRDTKASVKQEEKEEQDISDGRQLRFASELRAEEQSDPQSRRNPGS
ncbi:YihY/virulence factor BrkB family protein [Glutamicibacter sp. HZAU]|uniref:YihY/virulence factor BrkB family protein n=1 Tax=Glutamicibacter sp. HZAU TaxID=2049891 RepID=UPI000FFB1A3D|nr:YihY/virulence factor BrkB family protein [Glutamicibacter sp. HZAU]RWZ83749.1 YihY/virulence factor BrkB family protein [Glutamicibacter sp. HZAU]